ncbi:MAG: hypothetical protein AAGJ86_01305 [Pseudomonadota bacterium]
MRSNSILRFGHHRTAGKATAGSPLALSNDESPLRFSVRFSVQALFLVFFVLSSLLSAASYAVGNDVITDPEEAEREGFSAFDIYHSPEYQTVRFRLRAPATYRFPELGMRDLARIAFIRPDPGTEAGPMLMTAGTRIPIYLEDDSEAPLTGYVSLRLEELEGSYFEFLYRKDRTIPLMIHIPSCALIQLC